MHGLFVIVFLLSSMSHALTLNHTILQECASNFINCSDSNCTQIFNNCTSSAEIISKKPQSCYQAEAAAYALSVVFWVSMGLITTSILAGNTAIFVQFIAKKFDCCHGCVDLIEVVTKNNPTEPANTLISADSVATLFRAMTAKTVTTLGTVVAGVITYVSAGWIYNLWQQWTIKDADCRFYLDQQ